MMKRFALSDPTACTKLVRLVKHPELSMTEADDSLAGGRRVNVAENEDFYSFRSDDSFEPIAEGPAPMKNRPFCVPALDLSTLEEYQSVDES